jgi:cytochrome c peroxidase
MGGNLYQKFGVFEDMVPASRPVVDFGRFRVTKVARDRQVFRVPSLRNVGVTAPYFHDGREPELKGAVETIAKAQLGRNLTADEIARIVEFLNTLTGQYKGATLTNPATGVH